MNEKENAINDGKLKGIQNSVDELVDTLGYNLDLSEQEVRNEIIYYLICEYGIHVKIDRVP